MARFSILLATYAFFFVALLGCTRTPGSGSHQGNATGFGGVITLTNARPRCTFDEKEKGRLYDVLCKAMVVTPDGNESPAAWIQDGVRIDWKEPVKVDGGDVTVESCSVASSNLSQSCRIQLKTPVSTTLQFDLVMTEIATQKQNTESDVVLLPFSALMFGKVPALANYDMGQGAQNTEWNANEAPVGRIRSLCRRGDKIFFSTDHYVYVYEKGKIRLYAGSANPANTKDFSHRLRVAIGDSTFFQNSDETHIACHKEFIYIADRQLRRILRVADEGRVLQIADHRQVLHAPRAIQVGEDGSVYLIRQSVVDRIDAATGVVTTIGGGAIDGFAGDGGPATQALFNNPQSLSLAKDGSIYVADMRNARIRKIDKNGIVTTVAGSGVLGFSGDGGPAVSADMGYVYGVFAGDDGDFYIADRRNARVRYVNPQGTIRTIAGRGGQFFSGDGGLALNAQFNYPDQMALDSEGNLLVIDADNHRIRRIGKDGVINTIVGTNKIQVDSNVAYEGVDAQFGNVSDVVVGPDDSIYVADFTRNQIRRIDPAGKVSVFAGTGVAGFSGDGGPAKQAMFSQPAHLLIRPDGTLYVSDMVNRRIRKILPSGEVQTVAYSTDMVPGDLAMNSAGQLFYANTYSSSMTHLIGMIGPAGEISYVLRGAPTSISGLGFLPGGELVYTDGMNNTVGKLQPGSEIPSTIIPWGLRKPLDLNIDSQGKVFIADTDSGLIRRLTSDESGGYSLETYLGGKSSRDCTGAIKRNLSATNAEEEIQLSLATLCYSRVAAFDVRAHCEDPARGHITMAIGQSFGASGNVIRIRRPCH